MNITVATVGSRGDIQPYVALGRGLQEAGHHVQLAADTEFETFIRGHGLGFAPVYADPRQALEEDIRQIGSNPIRLLNWIKRNLKPIARQYVVDIKQACQGSDGILYSTLAFLSYHVAEAMQMATGDEALRRRATELGSKIGSEAGVSKAVEIIEHYFSTFHKSGSKHLDGSLAEKER